MDDIETIYADEPKPMASPRKLAPLREARPPPLKRNPRESWTENLQEKTVRGAEGRRSSAWVVDEGERRPSPCSAPEAQKLEEPRPEGSFVSDVSDCVKSPTSSQSSKRASVSGELSAQIRHKIREQARSVVAKKRGSVQLAKRLSRRQMQSTVDETYFEDQEEEIDTEIERSIALGEKYTSNELLASQEPSPFFTAGPKDAEAASKPRRAALVRFVKAFPPTVSQRLLQNSLIRVYSKSADFSEARFPGAESSIFVARPLRDWNLAKQRFGTDFVDSYGFLKGTELMTTRIPLRVERDADEEHLLLVRAGVIRWGEEVVFDQKRLHQLELRVERIVFDRHWLFSAEDVLAMDIRKLHDVQKRTGENVIRLLKEFVTQKKRILATGNEETRKLLRGKVGRLWKELEEKQRVYSNLGDAIEAKWTDLTALRETNATTSTTLNLEKTFLRPEGFADLASEMELFYRTPVYSLSETHPLSEERPLSENLRLKAIQGTHLLVQIHFNNIPVCTTKSRTLLPDFAVEFGQAFSLKVRDSPSTISLTILERSQGSGGYKELAKVGVPLPDHDQCYSPEMPLEAMEFAAQKTPPRQRTAFGASTPQSVRGRLFCSASWTEKGILAAHERKERKYAQGRAAYEFDGFHLIPQETRLASDEEFRSDLRLEALVARSEGRLRGPKALRIPLHSADIDPQMLFEVDAQVGTNGSRRWQLAIDVMRQEGLQKTVELRSHLKERLSRNKRSVRYEDLVREEPIPTMFGAFGSLFGQADTSRKLKPMRKEPTVFQIAASGTQIVVNVQSAQNLPTRADSSETQSLVRVEWRYLNVQTTVAKGANPSWNETLKIAAPKTNWAEVEDPIVFRLYDQKVTPLESDDREADTIHEQLSRDWLGVVEVSFSTLLSEGKFEGTLRLRTPLLSTNHRTQQKPVYLKVLVALDPVATPPSSDPLATVESAESEAILQQCAQWCKGMSEVVSTVADAFGRSTLLCRFLRPLRPPSAVEQLAGSLDRAAALATRIAGSISPFHDTEIRPSPTRIVVSADQLVSFGCGTALEKATLLVCWLLHLNLEPLLLQGRALPEGTEASFVVVRVADLHLLLNPNDGFCYRLGDPVAPLMSVSTAVVSDNHFANLQTALHPSKLSFDLQNPAFWRPLFPIPSQRELVSVQGVFAAYTPIPEDALVELRASLERDIKVLFDEARRFGVPQWNLSAARTLREILVEFDARDAPPPDLDARLQNLRGSFHTTVIAFQLPYRSREDVFQTVAATHLHQKAHRNAQFAVAVHLTPFFGGVLQVAVALAALIPH
ncbi:hypothetical protein QR680_009419 [Steinernema hermaphroditum]|uniref:C2 domain-containing protein n=1 Tax=Steinernema hermaphroditum TaxID=289476 RepID=A0AA39M9V7_9BILA|nr:hypothetical protein QR680_009419 [Steinernema hermaphroditum]